MISSTQQRLDRAQMAHNLTQFKVRWRERLDGWVDQKQTAIEKKYAQSFWSEFLGCFGVTATRMDLFEQDARRGSTGRHGWIDLFWPGVVLGEAKAPGESLDEALTQARDYLQGGSVSDTEQPRYIIASDFETFRLVRLGAPDQRFDITFQLGEVDDYFDQLRFLAGYDDFSTREEEEAASIKASKIMAKLFTAMAGDEVDENVGDEAPTDPEDEDDQVRRTSVFLTRLLFLLYGDDAGLWEQDLFYRFVLEHTNSENLGSQLDALFDVLNTPENKRRRVPEAMAAFPYVNGSIFNRDGETRTTTFFSLVMRETLLDACRFRWTDISPAIFGSLFQLVKAKEARRSDGEHYTSEKNILKTIGPLFLDGLRAESARLITSKSGSVNKQLETLRAFRDSLATHVFADPACGSGNFLIVAYRELRRIETDVIVAIRQREGNTGMALDITWEQKLSIGQFYGIELNWWPAKIAETAMFLVDHQANRELADRVGMAPERLPITITAHIHHDNALAAEWNKLIPAAVGETYIFGNPPFIGARLMSKDQKAELNQVWGEAKGTNQLDYVTGWHAQALHMLENRSGEFAYVTTNSISQGQPVPALFGPILRANWRIKFAHRTFSWDSEAPGKAAVHCVIVGFSRDQKTKQRLWDYPDVKGDAIEVPVENAINPYLVDGPIVLVETRSQVLSPELSSTVFGSMPNDGANLVPKAGTPRPTDDPVAMKYIRRFVGAKELIHGYDRWCYWMADENFDPADINRSPRLKEVVEKVRDLRLGSKRAATQKLAYTPYLFGEVRQPQADYLCIPAHVGANRMYFTAQRFGSEIICGNANFTVNDPDGLQFALLSSSMFITWQRVIGGQIKSDLRFANTLTWNTFPVPELDEKTRERIIKAGKGILNARERYPERSIYDHYNPLAMAPELIRAHDALDREVDKGMGASRKLATGRQRQEILFANYARMTSIA